MRFCYLPKPIKPQILKLDAQPGETVKLNVRFNDEGDAEFYFESPRKTALACENGSSESPSC